MLLWAKLIHIAAVSIWAGGLLALPLLLARGTRDGAVLRSFYIAWLSPAAFAALVSGIALLSYNGPHVPLFGAKLTLVLLLALIHILVARRIVARRAPAPRLLLKSIAATAGALALAIGGVSLVRPGLAQPGLAQPGLAQIAPCDPAHALPALVMPAEGGRTERACLPLLP